MLLIKQAHKNFGDHTVIDQLDLTIESSKLVTLLGPSGCGKSTLLRCIAGLETLDKGAIELYGEDITYTKPQKRNIAMVFQHYALFPNMTVTENIAFGLKIKQLSKDEINAKVENILKLVELERFASYKPAALSGGQKQRVALARGLVMEPKLLLLDEPLSALDARIRKNLRGQIRDIQRELKLTTVFVTHDQEEALAISDQVVLLNQGRIEQNTTPEKLYSNPDTEFTAQFVGNYNMGSFPSLRPNAKGLVIIRPEAVQLSQNTQDIPALIINRTLLGGVVRYSVKTQLNETLQVDVLNYGPLSQLSINEQVYLNIPDNEVLELAHSA